MKNIQMRPALRAVMATVMGSVCFCLNLTNDPDHPLSPAKYGYIHNADGSPCANATVILVPSEYVPAGQDTCIVPPVFTATTDTNGRYSLDTLAAGSYNVFGAGDTMVSFKPAVTVTDARVPQYLSRDTLSAPGGITGNVCLCPPADNRKMLILVLGSTIIRWPDGPEGHFQIPNLAQGTYRIRFLPTDAAYPVLDTAFSVEQGKVRDVGTIYIGYMGKPKTLKENQDAYIAMKFGLLLHFSLSTFTRYDEYSVKGEWALPASNSVTPDLFQPGTLNCGQWADAAKSAGCRYMILTVKHHDGFCLWNSRYTAHDVGNSSWGNGKRDVVREFTDSARARGLKAGFYYSIWDKTNGHSLDFIKGQLTELLTGYGDITCLFFDGWGWAVPCSEKYVPYEPIRRHMKSLQPNCLLISNTYYKNMTYTEIVEYDIPVVNYPIAGSADPQEGFESIRLDGCWFWHPRGDIQSTQSIKDLIALCTSRNANYLLNVTPDTSGLVPQCMVNRLKEVGGAHL